MKNLFIFATKELSQDAFLMWLIANYDCENQEVSNASHILLKNLLNIKGNIDVSDLHLSKQEHKIDILVKCKVNGVKYLLAIEDKTSSEEHNQLADYTRKIAEKYADSKFVGVFYKTDFIYANELKRVLAIGWIPFDIKTIYNVFVQIPASKNAILNDYKNHITQIYENLYGDLPLKILDWDLKHWKNFLQKKEMQEFDEVEFSMGNYRNQYILFKYRITGRYNVPILEIRSRDFAKGVIVRIVLYDVADEYITGENVATWKQMIRERGSNSFVVENYSKQIGVNKNQDNVNSPSELKEKIGHYISEYLAIFK